MLTGPIPATEKVLARSGLRLSDIDTYEVNEAFAPVPLMWQSHFGTDPDGSTLPAARSHSAIRSALPAAASWDRCSPTSRPPVDATDCRPCARAAAWPTPPSSNGSDRRHHLDRRIHRGDSPVRLHSSPAAHPASGSPPHEALIKAGAHVGVLDLPSSPGPRVEEEHSGALTFVPADVTSADDVTRALDILSERGPLRVVVNCAGIGPPGKVLGKDGPLPLDDFERIVRVNLTGTFNVIRLAAERISATESVDGERGVIVNTASVAAFDGQIGQPAYAAAKGGIVSMALPIARELARHQIRVVTVAPGMFDTPLLKTLSEDIRQSLGAQVPHPVSTRRPGRVRCAGAPHRREPDAERRGHPAGRCHPDGTSMTGTLDDEQAQCIAASGTR